MTIVWVPVRRPHAAAAGAAARRAGNPAAAAAGSHAAAAAGSRAAAEAGSPAGAAAAQDQGLMARPRPSKAKWATAISPCHGPSKRSKR